MTAVYLFHGAIHGDLDCLLLLSGLNVEVEDLSLVVLACLRYFFRLGTIRHLEALHNAHL